MSDIYGTSSLFLPLPWLTALAGSDVRMLLYGWRALYGVIRALHLLGLGGFYGASLLLCLRALDWLPAPVVATRGIADRFGPARVMHASFWLTIGSGVLLFLRDPIGVGLHSMFLPKLLLVGVGLGVVIVLRRARPTGRARRAGAVGLLAIWTAIVGCSTWNHVERPVAIGAMLRATNAVAR